MYLITTSSVIALTTILTVLATCAVGIRLSRVKRFDQRYKGNTAFRNYYLEDILCTAALVRNNCKRHILKTRS